MKAYLVGFSSRNTNDLSWIGEYLKIAPDILRKYNGKVVITTKPEKIYLGNDWERVTIIEFPSMKKLKQFHQDIDYLKVRELRIKNTIGEMYFLKKIDCGSL